MASAKPTRAPGKTSTRKPAKPSKEAASKPGTRKTAKPAAKASTKPTSATSAAVDQFMTSLDHPHKAAIEALRQIICSAHSSIAEGVKWNAPSFRTTEYFATTHLRAADGIGLILHLGAKAREDPTLEIADPERLLAWLGRDRAMASFSGADDVSSRAPALQAIVRQWIKYV